MARSIFRRVLREFPPAVFVYQQWRATQNYLAFLRDWRSFSDAATSPETGDERFTMRWKDRYPRLDDRLAASDFDPHYIYHVGWATRLLARMRPAEHVDISSFLYFSVAVSAFLPVTFYEFRPASYRLEGLTSLAGDLHSLPMATDSVPSLSCMHVIEHIGLGRYGDPIDPGGDLTAIAELKRVLAPGGSLLFVTPTGRPRICFNAHRVYSYAQIVEYFAPLQLKEFTLLPDDSSRGLIVGATADEADAQTYGCGCYHFVKP